MYEDKTLVCVECGEEFIFSARDQEFYAQQNYQNEPKRCKACRAARKNASRGPREYFTTICDECGGEARLPYDPSTRPGKINLCSACLEKSRARERSRAASEAAE